MGWLFYRLCSLSFMHALVKSLPSSVKEVLQHQLYWLDFSLALFFYFLYQAFRNHGTHVLLCLIPKEIIQDQMIHRSLKESQLSICSCRCSYNLSCHHQLLLHDGLSAPQLYFSSLKVKYHLCYLVSMADTKLMP